MEEVKAIFTGEVIKGQENPHIESLLRSIQAQAIEAVVKQEKEELIAIKKEQSKVHELQRLLQHTKAPTDDNSDLPITEELKTLLEKAKETGAVLPEYKDNKLTRNQRIDLIDRLRVVIDTLNQNNDFRLQGVQRITNLFHQICSLLRSIERSHSEAGRGFARNIGARG